MAANHDGIVFHFLGTGGAQQVPAFGCECEICQQAQRDEKKRRRACCTAITTKDRIILIDAGLPELAPYLLPYPVRHILLTHYHMDHVQGLFPLRWGYGDPIPVFGPRTKRAATISLSTQEFCIFKRLCCLSSPSNWTV